MGSTVPKKNLGRPCCINATGPALRRTKRLEPIENLVGPEALETGERLVKALEFLDAQADDFLDCLQLTVIERIDARTDVLAARREAHAHRALIRAGAFVADIARLDQLLEIVGDVRALVVAACLQFT